MGAARAARRGRCAARRGRAAQPEPRLAVRDAGDGRAGLCAAAGRARTFAVFVPIAAGIAAAAPAVLRVGDRLRGGNVIRANVHSAVVASFVAAVVVGLLVAPGRCLRGARLGCGAAAQAAANGLAAAAVVALVVVVAGGLAAAGNPITRIRHGWDSFKGGYGTSARAAASSAAWAATATTSTGSRSTNSRRTHWWASARATSSSSTSCTAAARDPPLSAQRRAAHARRDRSDGRCCSPDRARCGPAGRLARDARARSARRGRRRGGAEPASATGLVHGSVDWFWEFAGLGAPAFALLGLLCALRPGDRRAGLWTGG